jgi:hypothetical protein
MDVLTILVIGILNILCLTIGTKLGQAVVKGEKVEMPNINPLKAVKKTQAQKAMEREQKKRNTILQNIECYDGTAKGQKDV